MALFFCEKSLIGDILADDYEADSTPLSARETRPSLTSSDPCPEDRGSFIRSSNPSLWSLPSPSWAVQAPEFVPSAVLAVRRLAQEQAGSRRLQELCESGSLQVQEEIAWQCVEHASQLIEHSFGNYVVQKVIQTG